MFFSGFDVDQRKLCFFFIISDWLTWWNPIFPKTFLTLDEIEHFYVIFYAYKITKHSFMSHQMSRYIYSMYALIYFHSDPQFFYSLPQLLYTSEFSPCSWRLRMLMVSHYHYHAEQTSIKDFHIRTQAQSLNESSIHMKILKDRWTFPTSIFGARLNKVYANGMLVIAFIYVICVNWRKNADKVIEKKRTKVKINPTVVIIN